MPRFFVERDFGRVGEEVLQDFAARAKATGARFFPEIIWQGTYVCTGEDGTLKSFCRYEAPSADVLHAHTDRTGGPEINRVYEVVDPGTAGG